MEIEDNNIAEILVFEIMYLYVKFYCFLQFRMIVTYGIINRKSNGFWKEESQ